MSPTNLADLPGNQPAPTGLVQIKRGALEGAIIWNNTVPSGTPLQDGQGQWMSIGITPSRPGWWLIHASTLWAQVDAVWMSWEWGVVLSPADADGNTLHRVQCSKHQACSWNYNHVDCLYRLNQGVTYSAQMHWLYSTGYNQQYHTDKRFHYIEGEFIGEGAV